MQARSPTTAALAALACAAAILAAPSGASDPAPAGIDVSHHSGQIDWEAVAAHGFAFVYLKASEGVDDPDPMFEEHWRALGQLGIRRGAYHFYVTEDEPEAQAELFLSQVTLEAGDLPPVVDVEVLGHGTTGDLRPRLRRWLEIVEQRLGARPIIYTSARFWDAHFDDSFGHYPLWVAEYEVDAPTLPRGWGSWTLWQHAGDATVPGVEKGADLSRLHPEVELEALATPR